MMNSEATAVDQIDIDEIVVGERYRKSLGDIISLSKSIDKLGLLHPIVVDSRKNLVAGLRRLEACRLLGWTQIPCRVMSSLDDAIPALKAEHDENTCREPFAPLELVALGKALEAMERQKAKERQSSSGPKEGRGAKTGSVNFTEPVGQTRDKVGEALGVSGVTYQRMKAVAKAAEDDPETFGPIAEEMNATGKVMPAFEKVQSIKRDPLSVVTPESRGTSERPSKAIQCAHDAVNCLMRIPKNDPKRKRGFQIVADFIKANQ